jgi:hypothetical protein
MYLKFSTLACSSECRSAGDERECLCKSTMKLPVNHTLCHCIGITEMPISVGDYHRRATASQVHSCAGVEGGRGENRCGEWRALPVEWER